MADLTQTAANVAINTDSTDVSVVQAGESVTQGMPVYLKASDGKYYQCDADASEDTAEAKGIALTPASADGYFVMAGPDGGVNLGATLTVGETYVISATKGAIAPVGDLITGDYVTQLGIATTASNLKLNINISGVQVP